MSALFLYDQIKAVSDQTEAASVRPRPKGMGGLTEQLLDREVGDWHRFRNRRQVSSYGRPQGLAFSESTAIRPSD
jgi:hypothetical protein